MSHPWEGNIITDAQLPEGTSGIYIKGCAVVPAESTFTYGQPNPDVKRDAFSGAIVVSWTGEEEK